MYLQPEQISRYKIMSRRAVERYCTQTHKRKSMIISIKSSWDKVFPNVFMSDTNNVKRILPLSFDDVTYEESPNLCMSENDGKKVADFVNKYYDDVDVIIVHCDGGISRSAGVCAAIMRAKEGEDFPIFDNRNKHPNMTCYLQTLKGFDYI